MSERQAHVTLPGMPAMGVRTRSSSALGFALALPLSFLLCLSWALPERAHAQSNSSLELSFVPTDRAQIAVWVERDDGQFMGTLALTYAVAYAGIGNRPGALQMNSGFRWPYGRREGVLPVWAHRRAAAADAKQFRRVIFQNRTSEGHASRSSADQSVDDYYCLSFDRSGSDRDALDAVTCASVFSSDKGRFISEQDVDKGYGEPSQDENGAGHKRPLSLWSLYPPRRDVARCTTSDCYDHIDVASYQQHARDVMPELDAISQATPPGNRRVSWNFQLPNAWTNDHEYVLYVEVNVEGDYNESWSARRFPTPGNPEGLWDTWAETFGYPYRGQRSLVYALPFSLDASEPISTRTPAGYGALEGQDGELRMMDATISDDPQGAQGSGADRMIDQSGSRLTLKVLSADPCARPDKPAACGASCSGSPEACGALFCNPATNTCESYCVATAPPGAVADLRVDAYPDRLRAHMWARLSFKSAASVRPIAGYDVKIKAEGGDWTPAYTPDAVQELLPVALDVCNDPSNPMQNRCLTMQPGTLIEVDLAKLNPTTHYSVAVTPRDALCSQTGTMMMADFTTPSRTFSTVSPCFVATAAYGSPLAGEIGVLRRLRDRYLAPHAPGRALIAAYYRIGPELAAVVRGRDWLRAAARGLISPWVELVRWWGA